MPKARKVKAKKSSQTTKRSAATKTRQLPKPKYRSFKLSKRIKSTKPPIPGSFRLFYRCLRTLGGGWKLFGGISLIYLVVSLLLVRSLSISVGAGEIKDALQQVFSEQNGQSNQLAVGLTIYGLLVSNVNAAASSAGSVYQAIFLITFSLAIVWALRRWLADSTKKIRIRDAFYKGMYPLVPVILVFLVIGLQLIPVYIASFLFSAVFATGLAVTALEQITWASIIFLLTLLSLYMLSSSIFALYIATLPDVGPMQALRSARELVRHRRWIVLRKILFLPIAMVVLVALFIIPMILISPMVAEWTFFGLSALSLGVVHSYLYGLYRELL